MLVRLRPLLPCLPFLSTVLSTVALPAPEALAAVTWSVTASTSFGAPLDAVAPGDQIFLDIGVVTSDRALAIAGSVNDYDDSILAFAGGTVAPNVFNAICLAAPTGCLGGLTNQIGSAITLAERAVGPGVEVEFLAALGLAPAGGDGSLDEPFPQFQLVFDVIGPGSTTLRVGTFAEYLDGYVGTEDSISNNVSVSVFTGSPVIPEPGTALLVGLGAMALTQVRSGSSSRSPRRTGEP